MAGHEATGGQFLHHRPVDTGRRGEVEGGQSLLSVTSRLGKATGQALLAAAFELIIQQHGRELRGREMAFAGLGSARVQGEHHARKVELAQLGQ